MSTIILDLRATNWDEMCTKRIVAVAESRKHIIERLRFTFTANGKIQTQAENFSE